MSTLTPAIPKVTLDPWQQRFFRDEARVQVVCRARELGKDFTTAAKAVLSAMQTGEAWTIVSLTQRQADETFAKCKEWTERYRGMLGEIAAIAHAERRASWGGVSRSTCWR